MDYLRQGIHLRGYAQKDYRFEFKREAFELFAAMLERIKFETASFMATLEVRTQLDLDREEEERRERLMRAAARAAPGRRLAPRAVPESPRPRRPCPVRRRSRVLLMGRCCRPAPLPEASGPFVRNERKVGRNEPCPCGSGKKFKHCHGVL